jgi:CubicO group peptidase (beta-lactamase class C family)
MMSQSRQSHTQRALADHVERGDVPGVVAAVSQGGDVYVEVLGTKAASSNEPMQRDTIFRIASMTKPIIAAATMMLIEEGTLHLDDPVDILLPELAQRKVLKRVSGSLEDTVPANRRITVRDLLTMRMGFGFILEPSSSYPVHQAATELGVMPGPPMPLTPYTPDEWLSRFAMLPLLYQPGERWTYPTAFSVLGVLLARATDQPLETLLRERIFEPLGMKDSGFSVSADKLDRLASCYTMSQAGTLVLYDDASDSAWRNPPLFPDADGGLVSTLDDYLAFGKMMLAKGTYGRKRLLSEASVEAMTSNHLTPEQQASAGFFLEGKRGWGFGMSVITQHDDEDVAAVPGRFGWDGGLGTSWYSDPRHDLVGILMTQVMGFPSGIYQDFWTSIYQAIDS